MKKILIITILIGSIFFSGCNKSSIKTMEKNEKISSEKKEEIYNNVKNQKDLLKSIEEAEVDTDQLWNKHVTEQVLRTSDNGVKKLSDPYEKKELISYRTYKVIPFWSLDNSLTKDKEKDAIWEIIGRNKFHSYVEVYMLPTYTGDIANLDGERLSEKDLDNILKENGANFVQTKIIQIEKKNWHVGLEISDENNIIRVSFFKMDPDKGNFNESILVAQALAPLNTVMESKVTKQEFLEHISQVKKMLTTFSETKEKEVSVVNKD